MGEDYKLIAAITPNTTNWTAKVVVLEKTFARTAYHSPTKYQNVVVMDMEDNQLQVLDEALITVEENHFFYLKAIKKDGPTDQWKYDIIFTLEPSTTRENVQPLNHPKHSSSTSQTINFVPQLMPPPAKRMLFEVPPISASNKRLTEETLLHRNAETAILKLSAIATPAMKNKEKVPATK
ncbi:Uncharacterized protein Adt_18232 [Abeliophyllum distichum]|uniref:Uncharacterized protein n=1 Tax=Abeliophyllum distichum TaxID=126358 RepID=A0ABD1TIS9_9LAMI